MLTYIQWTRDIHIDKYHIMTFNRFGKYEFIEVEYIDRFMGFMRIRDKFYVFDKENKQFMNKDNIDYIINIK